MGAAIEVTDLTLAYGERVIQRDLTFTVAAGDVFVIMGGSGCGKSTLLRNMLDWSTSPGARSSMTDTATPAPHPPGSAKCA